LSDKGKGWLIALVAIAALVIGFAASSLAYRYRLLRVPHEPVIVRMQRELNLTFSQREQVLQIIEDTRSKILGLRQQFERERREQLRQAYSQIRALLTPEQQQKFDREFKPPPERFGLPGHGAAPGPRP
jgi:Spy/CpxP family protein refolding chaperone